MRTSSFLITALFSGIFATFSAAGEYNKVLKIGDKAPSFTPLPGTDGKSHSLEEWKDKKALVIFFTCNSCPTAEDYEDRVIRFTKKYSSRSVGVVAFCVNKIADDSMEKMKEKAEKKKFPFVYLRDDSQKIAKDFGASYTPEFFLLDQDRKVVYMGAFDDKNTEAEAKVNYLELATEALLKGDKIEKAETLARGCMIRYIRKRD
ncbi:thioredoxin family protein [Telmatocola sphagniphila]|uniref:Thioredoxin family protein n=1 Tax=Telmatocola sphagniphila TaxID=1123043 RepID=A0A8E6B177_9BACT|nr:thioredoxin family protein [Telmatocola sphagniphila]QVL29863.1 thioredoxin family protein [Telmatocola sphagniphila]